MVQPRSSYRGHWKTERRLDGILELLENYRQVLRVSKPRIRAEDDPKAVIVRYYRLPTNIADDLLTALPALLRTDTWQVANKDAPGTIRKLSSTVELQPSGGSKDAVAAIPHSVLVIRQMREVHDEIPELIHRIEHGDGLEGRGFGGGGGGFGGGFFAVPENGAARKR